MLILQRFTLTIAVIFSFLWISSTLATSETRGIRVKLLTKESPGAPVAEEVNLYDSSYALVIGIDNYTQGWPRLSNAVRDAKLVAEELRRKGFEVTLKTNLKSNELEQVFKEFFIIKGDNTQARLFVWFAGHGHTLDGEGFLVPADAPRPDKGIQFRLKALSMRRFGEYVRLAQAKHAFAVFDSCFSGTIFTTQRSSPPIAITRVTALPVRQFLSSGDAQQQVSDDGMFRKLFIRAIRGEERADANGDGYLTGSELGLFLTDRMTNLTRGAQTPRYGKLRDPDYDRGDFVFLLANSGAVIEEPATKPSEAVVLPKESGASFDDILKAEEEQRQAKEKWNEWQQAREKEYRSIKKIDESKNLTSQQKTVAWQRFLAAVSQDNPYRRQDDEMRSYSRSRLNHWQSVKPPVAKPDIPAGVSGSEAKEAGRDGTFIAYVTGVVYDKNAGLEWIAGPDRNTNWYAAKKWVESLNVAGGGWRMPTRDELKTLYQKDAGARNMTPLLKTTGWYVWSGETMGSSSAWALDLFYGGSEYWTTRATSSYGRGFAVRSRKEKNGFKENNKIKAW